MSKKMDKRTKEYKEYMKSREKEWAESYLSLIHI